MSRTIASQKTIRRIVGAGLAAAALSTAACSDEATAPVSAARAIDDASKVTVGGGIPQVATFISVRIIDVTGNLVTEKAMVRFRWSQPKDSVFVMDNSAKDLDPTIGIVRIAAPKAAGYDGCVRGVTAHFAADSTGPSYPTCNSKFWLAFENPLGNVYMRRKPQLTVKMIDFWNTLLPGATLRVYTPGWLRDVADGQAGMDEPSTNNGKITVTLPKAGNFVWGAVKTPTGHYVLDDSQWHTADLEWEENKVAYLFFKEVAY